MCAVKHTQVRCHLVGNEPRSSTQMSKIESAHAEENLQALLWSKMLADPASYCERAPSSTPFLASKARFVRSFDIPYSQTLDGNFAIAAIPSSNICAVVSSASNQIVSSPTALSFESVLPAGFDENSSYLGGTIVNVLGTQTMQSFGTLPFVDGSVIDPSLTGIPGLQLICPNASSLSFDLTPVSQSSSVHYFRVGFANTATHVIAWGSPIGINAAIAPVTVPADSNFVVLQLITQNTTPVTNRQDLKLAITMVSSSLLTTGVLSNASSFSLLKSEVLDAGRVGNHRCTAMSMFVTNMAAPLVAGGELVTARCPFSVLSSGSPANIMTTIKQLPEERYWRSGAIKDGSYAWWLPDDLQSYEPTPYPEASQPENILVSAGKMSEAGGFVRVILTYVFEFYTPVQLFSRDYNFTYSEMVRDLWNQLVFRPAVSANAGHAALIAGAISLATTVYNFYQQHKDLIDPAAATALKLAKKSLRNNRPQKKQSQPPPKPPRPSAQSRTRTTGATS